MRKIFYHLFILLFICLLNNIPAKTQPNFRQILEQTDPVPKESTISIEERIKIHQSYLEKAISEKNEEKQLFGYLYRFYDCLKEYDYPQATTFLLNAEKITEESENEGWKGAVSYRRGVLNVRLKNEEKAFLAYENAAKFCGEAGDSLCLGESLEQMGAMSSKLDSFERAKIYFEQAISILERLGAERQLISATNNLGGMYLLQGQAAKGIAYLQKGIALRKKEGNLMMEAKGINNLASAYRKTGKIDTAIQLFKECITINEKHHFVANKINNYLGLYFCYIDLEDYKSALYNIEQYSILNDSLVGAETQQKVAILEAKFKDAQKELALEKSQNELVVIRSEKERMIIALFVLLLLLGLGIWQWRLQRQKSQQKLIEEQQKLAENQENLIHLTNVLLKKNTLLVDMETQLANLKFHPQTNTTDDNFYNQSILTHEDWADFKTSFEKSYPGYLMRLRAAHPTLTEAEERLFLFIKLKLTGKEIAAILGISVGSVKKTRNRLRKRLELSREDSLEGIVLEF